MNEAASCDEEPIYFGGEVFAPIPFGQERRFGQRSSAWLADPDARCHDCGVLVGGFHHEFCDYEECPRCHGQRLSCDCLAEFDPDDEDFRNTEG
jgi:hypothetical protein